MRGVKRNKETNAFLGSALILCLFGALTSSNVTFGKSSGFVHNEVRAEVADIKMDHRVGAGVMLGGAAGVLGVLVDININPFVTASAHVGTGYDYLAFGVKGQFFVLGSIVHPYVGFGFSHWRSSNRFTNIKDLYPSYVFSSLMSDEQKQKAASKGFALNLIYPCFGIQYVHDSRFGASAELMYLFDTSDFKGAPYFGINTHYYF